MSALLPECMMQDSANPCAAFAILSDKIEQQTLVIQNLELELERIKTKNASLYNLLALINKRGGLDYDTHDQITTAIAITPT